MSLAKIVEEISVQHELATDCHSQSTELVQHQSEEQQPQNKDKFIKATRKLMKLTVRDDFHCRVSLRNSLLVSRKKSQSM